MVDGRSNGAIGLARPGVGDGMGVRARGRAMLACAVLAACGAASAKTGSERLNIHVVRDRLTLAVTKYPQVYLYGRIDGDAPRRFEQLMKAGTIVPGSDVYLSSRDGDPAAGMALGRLIRAGDMATHLSAPRKTFPHAGSSRTALCVDACAYAFLGGLYRWAPSGSDRFGLTSPANHAAGTSSPFSAGVKDYLAQMGIDPTAFAPAMAATPGRVAWFTPEQLTAAKVVNNGKLVPKASYDVTSAEPSLDLRLTDRKGEHRLTVLCRPGHTLVTAYEHVGAARARQIASRGGSSYFEINGNPVLEGNEGVSAEGDLLVIRRDYPPSDLVDLLFAGSVGAWVTGRSKAFRDGFAMNPWPLRDQLKVFYYACWRAAPWPPRVRKAD